MHILWTLLAYIASLTVIAPLTLVVVLLLVGPHTGVLPMFLERPVLLIGCLVVLLLPLWIAYKVWKRLR
jgi:hypothetical protein